jgi:hypothetical protein
MPKSQHEVSSKNVMIKYTFLLTSVHYNVNVNVQHFTECKYVVPLLVLYGTRALKQRS